MYYTPVCRYTVYLTCDPMVFCTCPSGICSLFGGHSAKGTSHDPVLVSSIHVDTVPGESDPLDVYEHWILRSHVFVFSTFHHLPFFALPYVGGKDASDLLIHVQVYDWRYVHVEGVLFWTKIGISWYISAGFIWLRELECCDQGHGRNSRGELVFSCVFKFDEFLRGWSHCQRSIPPSRAIVGIALQWTRMYRQIVGYERYVCCGMSLSFIS